MQRITRFLLAPILILGGLWFFAMPFLFATMLIGGPDDRLSWGQYLGAVWDGGSSALGLGFVMIAGGISLAVPRNSSPEQRVETRKS